MKKYFIISFILFVMLFIIIVIAKSVFGGDALVPFWFLIVTFVIFLNTLIATIYFGIKFLQDTF